MKSQHKAPPYQAIILIANRFDEEYVVHSLCQLRDAGLRVGVVSTRSGTVRGNHGLSIVPDLTISRIENKSDYALIVPGDKQCIASLLADPRVCHLLEKTNRSWQTIITTSEASRLFLEAGLTSITPSDCLVANDANTLTTSLTQVVRNHQYL